MIHRARIPNLADDDLITNAGFGQHFDIRRAHRLAGIKDRLRKRRWRPWRSLASHDHACDCGHYCQGNECVHIQFLTSHLSIRDRRNGRRQPITQPKTLTFPQYITSPTSSSGLILMVVGPSSLAGTNSLPRHLGRGRLSAMRRDGPSRTILEIKFDEASACKIFRTRYHLEHLKW